MKNDFEADVESLAKNIRVFAKKLRVDAFLSLIEVSDLVKKYAEIYTSQKPTSTSGYNILNALILNGGKLTATDISKQIFRSRYTVTRLIDTLEKQGLVQRKPTKKDRRMKFVYITKKGVELVEKASADMKEAVINIALNPLNQESVQQLNKTLKMLKSHLIYLVSQNRQYYHYEPPGQTVKSKSLSKGSKANNQSQAL